MVDGPIQSPLAQWTDGVVRVGRTRVTLHSVISVFQEGSSPEEIGAQNLVLTLADAYAVVAYELQHRAQVDTYLAEVQRASLQQLEVTGFRKRQAAPL